MSQSKRDPIAIGYLPWAGLHEEFRIGPVSFWPFREKVEEKIPDCGMRAELDEFFKTFVDHEGAPVKTILACSCGELGYRRFSDEELESIVAAVDCLIFATIASGTENGVLANNNSMAPPSADRFDLSGRWVWPIEDGLVIKTEHSTNLWSRGEYKITRPLSLGGSFCGNYKPLLQGLGCIFGEHFPEDVRERLFRSLEWFRFAHTESTTVSWLHKVVMMSTAFEILLQFPNRDQKMYFAQQIDKRLRLKDSIVAKRADAKGKEYEGCLAAWWAWDFYHLRGRIVHGNAVTAQDQQYKDWISHLNVADLVLLELVKKLLFQHHCIGEDMRRRAAECAASSGSSAEELEEAMLPGLLGLNFEPVHKALGWIPPSDQRKDK